MDKNRITEIVSALRCTSTEGSKCKGKECPYFYVASEEERNDFFEKTGAERDNFPEDFFDQCDIDRIGNDAADVLEEML